MDHISFQSQLLYRLSNFKLGDSRLWSRLRKLMAILLIAQLILFLWIYAGELKERWEDISPLLAWTGLASLIVVLVLIIYFKWLDKIQLIHRVVGALSKVFMVLYLLQWVALIVFSVSNPPITLTQLGSILGGYGMKRDYVDYERISPHMKLAVLASEDQLFPDHDGFDVKAIKLALKYNKRRPGKTRGASTISQQTAKNIFLWQSRNFIRKGLEVYFTFMIETFWSKKTILCRYLNVIETGPGLFGVQAAAKQYFNKNAQDLSRTEAAMIAAGLPNPKKYTIKPMSNRIRSQYDDIMIQMNQIEPDPDILALIH